MVDQTLKNANILIVDDEEANIDVLKGLLEIQGYSNVKSTTNPLFVKSLLKTFNPDLILLDLMMIPITGFEVLEQIKAHNLPNYYIPVLVLTADATQETKQRALAGGANDFLTKPFDLIEVGLRIKNLLETRYLHQQLENQNYILEKKVKERTFELEKINRELVAAVNKAHESDKLKTAFIRNISHEIRTPLNGILGISTLVTDQDLSVEEKQECIPLLKESISRMESTINDYLDISMIVSENTVVIPKPFNVVSELNDLKFKFQPLCDRKKLSLELAFPLVSRDLIIQTDPVLFRKIISHLLDNAIKFTNRGSITMGFSAEKTFVEFFVKDTGTGVKSELQERIFESFMKESLQTNCGYEGSGLGLAITKGLTVLLGGQIWLESVKGKGSVFYVKLPLQAAS